MFWMLLVIIGKKIFMIHKKHTIVNRKLKKLIEFENTISQEKMSKKMYFHNHQNVEMLVIAYAPSLL